MPRSELRLLRTTCTTLIAELDGGKHCLCPEDNNGCGCIKFGLVNHMPSTRRHMHQRGGKRITRAVLSDLDPLDLCAACSAEWHIKRASTMSLRAAEHAESLRH